MTTRQLAGVALGLTLWACLGGSAFAVEPIRIDLLKVEGWEVAEGPKTWIGGAVEEKIDGFVVFHQGFNLNDTQWLLLAKGDQKLDVFVFTYDSPANAYGLYSVMRRTIMQAGGAETVDTGDEASFHPMGQLVAWAGRSCIIVSTAAPQPPEKEAFVAPAQALASQLAGKSERPELVRLLPTGNLDDGSIIYCHYRQALDQVFYVGEENLLRLGDDVTVPTQVEAVYAVYSLQGRSHPVMLIRYPDEAEATQAATAFGSVRAESAKADTTEGPWRDIEARNGKHTLVYRANKLLAIAPDAVVMDEVKSIILSAASTAAAAAEPFSIMGYG